MTQNLLKYINLEVRRYFLGDRLFLLFLILLIPYFAIQLLSSVPDFIKLAVGFPLFVIIPGFYVILPIRRNLQVDTVGYGIIFGLVAVILNISVYHILSVYFTLNYNIMLVVFALADIVVIKAIFRNNINHALSGLKSGLATIVSNPLFYIFLFSIGIHLYYSTFNNTSLRPDAALYLDTARYLVSNGTFQSHVINDDLSSYNPYLVTNGLIEHKFFAFLVSLLFSIYQSSIAGSNMLTVLASSLIIYPVYNICNRIFDRRTGLLAALLISIHPLLLYFSAIPYGPEIVGLLFILTTIYFLMEGLILKSKTILFTSGLLFGLANDIWWAYYYILLPTIPVFYILYNVYDEPISLKRRISRSLFLSHFLFLYSFALKVYSLFFIWIPVVTYEFIALILAKKSQKFWISNNLYFVIGIIVSSMLPILRNYITPLQVSPIVDHALRRGVAPSVLNAYTLYFNNSFIQGLDSYVRYFSFHTGPILLILFLFSFLVAGTRARIVISSLILVHVFLIAATLNHVYPDYLYPSGRYFLFPTVMMLMGASKFIWFGVETIQTSIKKTLRTDHIINSVLAISITTAFIVAFIPSYQSGIHSIESESPKLIYGWTDKLLNWIHDSDSTPVLTTRPRELAWLSNHNVLNIINPPSIANSLDDSELVTLGQRFGTHRFVVDKHFHDTLPLLRYMYNDFQNYSGSKLSIAPKESIEAFFTNKTQPLFKYRMAYLDNSTESNTKVWTIEKSNSSLNYLYDETSFAFRSAGNAGNISNSNNNSTLTIGKNQSYAYSFLTYPVNLFINQNNSCFFAWNISSVNNIDKIGLEIWDAHGNHEINLSPPVAEGIWSKYIQIKSLGDIRVVISGKPGSSITVNWIKIGELKNE